MALCKSTIQSKLPISIVGMVKLGQPKIDYKIEIGSDFEIDFNDEIGSSNVFY